VSASFLLAIAYFISGLAYIVHLYPLLYKKFDVYYT